MKCSSRWRDLAVVIAFVVMIAVTIVVAITDLAFTDFPVMVAFAFMGTKVSLSLGGPGMIVVYPAMFSIPVAIKESLSIVTGHNPVSAGVWRPTPKAFMPFVVASDRVPVALHPHEFRTGTCRPECNDAGSGRRANSDSNGDLSKNGQGKEYSSGEKACPQERFAWCEIHDRGLLLVFVNG